MKSVEQSALQELQRIPGIGKTIAKDLWKLGMKSVTDLRAQDPKALYEQLCLIKGHKIDRCMLYVLRCAVYYASNDHHDAELLKWWNWKDHR